MLAAYLSFSRKERNAVLLLVILIILLFVTPYLIPTSKETSVQEMMLLDTAASLEATINKKEKTERRYSYNTYEAGGSKENKRSITVFYFDPNTLSASGWMKLGVKERTITTIQKYLSKGGRFREGNDLKKIFGLPPELTEVLIPYVKIPAANENAYTAAFPTRGKEPTTRLRQPVDINKADSISLLSLDGIGPKLAGRILKFREKLGGFVEIRQLGEVYGLADSSFKNILPQLMVSAVTVKKINVNHADLSLLRQHPYVGRKLAEVIIQYRQQHGHFNTVEELSAIDIITPDLLRKLAPYLTTERE